MTVCIKENHTRRETYLLNLPVDIFIAILKHLDVNELAVLSRTCRALHDSVASIGWLTYTLSRPRPSISLSRHLGSLSLTQQARYIHLTDRGWSSQTSVARPLSLHQYAIRDAIPYLVATPSMLVIAVANALHVYDFLLGGLQVRFRGEVQLHRGGAQDDITGLGVLNQPGPGGGEALIASCANGKVLRVRISPAGEPLRATVTGHYTHPARHITSLSTSRWESKAALALTTALGGLVSLYNTRSPWVEPTRADDSALIAVPGTKRPRIWCSLIAQSDSVAITGSTKLSLHPILSTGLGAHATVLPGPARQSACYALAHPPGDQPNLVLSGWHDGKVRMYDLRTEAVEMVLRDPWSDSGVYCVGAGGGSAAHVVAGYSKHGMLAIFDIRSPSTAYTTYAPASSLGPPRPHNGFTQLSSLHVEGSRIFGTTPHRPFVFDFGPDTTQDTYPYVKEVARRLTPDGRGFETQSYDHLMGLARKHM